MIKDIREQDSQKIKNSIIQLKSRLLEYRFKVSQGSFTTTHLIRECKKTIAQLLTILREKNETITNKDWKKFIELHKEEQEKIKVMAETQANSAQDETKKEKEDATEVTLTDEKKPTKTKKIAKPKITNKKVKE